MLGVGFLGESGPKAPIVLGTKILSLYCFASSITLCIPSIFTRTARGTFCSPMALRRAEKCMSHSTLWLTTIFWSPLKSNISANMYGPSLTTSGVGLMMSERMTCSLPYFPRRYFAHSTPSWPRPPASQCVLCSLYKLLFFGFSYMRDKRQKSDTNFYRSVLTSIKLTAQLS